MSGVVAGLIGSVKSAAATPTNLVLNPSFTDDSTAGWSGEVFSRVTDFFRTAPASLVYSGNDYNPQVIYSRNSVLTVGVAYSLSIWIRTFNTQSFLIQLSVGSGGASFQTATQSQAAGWVNYKIENYVCQSNTNLAISVLSDYSAYIDDVSVVQGATALVL